MPVFRADLALLPRAKCLACRELASTENGVRALRAHRQRPAGEGASPGEREGHAGRKQRKTVGGPTVKALVGGGVRT